MEHVILPQERAQCADEAVAAGRFRDRGEVVAAGLRLLQQTDRELAGFRISLENARALSHRHGWVSLDAMTVRMDQALRETADRAA